MSKFAVCIDPNNCADVALTYAILQSSTLIEGMKRERDAKNVFALAYVLRVTLRVYSKQW